MRPLTLCLYLVPALAACAASRPPITTPPVPRDPIHVQLLWPDGGVYHGGVGWQMTGTCSNHFVSTSSRTFAGNWRIDWPKECLASDALELHLDVMPNPARCSSVKYDGRVAPGDHMLLQPTASSRCRAHADDP